MTRLICTATAFVLLQISPGRADTMCGRESAHVSRLVTSCPAASIRAICDPDDRLACEHQGSEYYWDEENCECVKIPTTGYSSMSKPPRYYSTRARGDVIR